MGNSFTGVELSANVSMHAKVVHHSYTTPFWILEHFIAIDQTKKDEKVPIDFFLFSRAYRLFPKMDYQDMVTFFNKLSEGYCQEQQQFEPLRIDEKHFDKPIAIGISSHYLQKAKEYKIIPHHTGI